MTRSSIIVFLTSITLVGLEIIWTRLFSAEFFYTFAFLVLSFAIMGIGLGALSLRFFPGLREEEQLPRILTLTGVCALAAPPLVVWIGVDFSAVAGSWVMGGKFAATVILLASSYCFGGMTLANVFRRHHRLLPRVYMADLIGAAAGVVLAVIAMNRLGTPMAALWAAGPVLIGALLVGGSRFLIIPLLPLAAIVGLSPFAPDLLEPNREERAPVIYKHWDAMAKIKMYDFGGYYRGLNIDNVANSPVIPFDGVWEDAGEEDGGSWDIDVGYLVDRFDSCVFLSLGSGGGSDVLQALDHGAAEIHAVEVNSHINRMMTVGDPDGYIVRDSTVVDSTGRVITCAEYSGGIYRDPRVSVVSEDARSYVRRHPGAFDVIYSLSSNTWAALASGSFALAESYIFTTEAFGDYWAALSDSGFMSMEHQVYMPRLITQAVNALEKAGVEDPRAHVAVYDLPKLRRKLLLLSKRPLTEDLRYRAYGPLTPDRHGDIHLLYPAADSLADNLINRIMVDGWRSMSDSVAIDLSPCTDNRPFVAQLGLWKNFSWDGLKKIRWLAEFRGFPLAKLTMAGILAVLAVLVIPLNLMPYLGRGEKLRPVPWLYFFLIGAGFMMVEIVLIQKYALFIGASVYSLPAVLCALLFASGLGSLVSGRVGNRAVFVGITLLLLLEILVFRTLTNALSSQTLAFRIGVTAALVFPLGFLLGMPFPKGGMRVGPLIDWGFAVNGAASVLGATAVVLIAMTQGFAVALLVATGLYALAGWLLTRESVWSS